MLDDTIAAIATPIGEGGLAVIRISGMKAFEIADRIFVPRGKSSRQASAADSHTIHYGHVVMQNKVIDEVLLSVMRAPRTFTREHVVEITCHGGILPAKAVLDAVLGAGARVALPGEFTRRAFLHGRIDLAQAEAVVDVIQSRTELALAAANEQLAGKLSQRINELRDRLMRTLAHIEAHIDFPEEDISPHTRKQLLISMEDAGRYVDVLLATAGEGQLLRRGIRIAIIGRPNAGKSSLLNQLLGHDRAIVSPLPGTTRDTIEETANIRGIPVVFVDTAGLREGGDEIEMEGIRRSHETIARADLILHVLDASERLAEEDRQRLSDSEKCILILNKSDLPVQVDLSAVPGQTHVRVSCKTGDGIEALKDAIKGKVWAGEIDAEMVGVMVNSRHEDALRRSRTALGSATEGLKNDQTLEVIAMELRIGISAIGEIVGKTSTEDLLDSIFSQFCIGK